MFRIENLFRVSVTDVKTIELNFLNVRKIVLKNVNRRPIGTDMNIVIIYDTNRINWPRSEIHHRSVMRWDDGVSNPHQFSAIVGILYARLMTRGNYNNAFRRVCSKDEE